MYKVDWNSAKMLNYGRVYVSIGTPSNTYIKVGEAYSHAHHHKMLHKTRVDFKFFIHTKKYILICIKIIVFIRVLWQFVKIYVSCVVEVIWN